MSNTSPAAIHHLRNRTMMRVLLRAPLLGAAFVVIALPQARANGPLLAAFNSDPVVSKDELANLRGGFNLGNGLTVNFGLEIQQIINKELVNDVNIVLAQNKFTVTQTTGGKTVTSDLTAPQTFKPAGPINNGATNLAVTVTTQAIQSIVQNSANNQALTSNTTLNVSTQGLVNALHQTIASGQLIQTLQMNGWVHH